MNKKQILNKNSLAYGFTMLKDEDDNYFFNLRDSVSIDSTDTSEDYFNYHLVMRGETFHSIAYKYYGTERLWWIIVKFNNIENPIDFPSVGSTLKVLKPAIKNSILNIIHNS